MTDDELSALRAAAEAYNDALDKRIDCAKNSGANLAAANLAFYKLAYPYPDTILRLLAHVEALTEQRDMLMAARDDMANRLRQVRSARNHGEAVEVPEEAMTKQPTDDMLEAMMLAMLDASDNAEGYAAVLQYGIGPAGKEEMRAVFGVVLARMAGYLEDADRYRWLRAHGDGRIIAPYTWWECGCKPIELDAAVDDEIARRRILED